MPNDINNGSNAVEYFEDYWEHIIFCMKEKDIEVRRLMLSDRFYIPEKYICRECFKNVKEVNVFIYNRRVCKACHDRIRKKIKKIK